VGFTKSDLQEALTAAGSSALINKIIDPLLLELQRRYSPLVRAVPTIPWSSTVYNFNSRTSRVPGGFVQDGGARPVGNSVYAQTPFTIRNMQAVGAVTGYAQAVTAGVIGDLKRREFEGAAASLYWDIEAAMCWGNEASTQNGAYPEFNGLDTQVSTFSGVTQNVIDMAGGNFSLGLLDQLADMVESNAAMPVYDAGWMFVMSNTAVNRATQLVQNNQRYVNTTEVAAGLQVPTYRGIPLVKTSFLSTRSMQLGTVTTATATTGGTLAAATYRYSVAPVIARQGEIVPSAEVTQAATGSTSTVTLTLPVVTGLDGAGPLLYKVFRSTGGAGTPTLLGYVDAVVGLAADGVTPIMATSIVDDGIKLTPMNGATVPAVNPAAYVGTNASMKPLAAGQENLYLVSRSRDNLVRPYVREVTPLDVYPTTSSPDSLPFALMTDTTLAVRAPRFTGRLTRVNVALSA
jgi:hypothetical protein